MTVMTPTIEEMWSPLEELWAVWAGGAKGETATTWELARAQLQEVGAPLLEFMTRHTDPDVREAVRSVGEGQRDGIGAFALAFLISELTAGLALAVMVLVPFVGVNLVVSQVLGLAGGGEQVSLHVALPAKIAVFLAAGGWTQFCLLYTSDAADE